jgi:syntaxin 1B/2/3
MNDLLSKSFGKKSNRNYVDLKRDAFRRDDDDDVETPTTGGEREMEVLGAGGRDTTQFFQEVGVIKAEMERIKEFLTKIQGMNEESKMLHQAQAMSALRDRMDADIAQVTKIARSLKAKLENLDRANAANRRMPGCEPGSTTDRTRASITSTLRKKLKDLMGDFQLLRQRMMGDYRQTVERRSVSATPQFPLQWFLSPGNSLVVFLCNLSASASANCAKLLGQNHFAKPSWHVLTFLPPILISSVTY